MSTPRSRPQAGFTLLEILLVIVLIAVTVAMVAPSFFTLAGTDIDDEARRMQQALRLAAEESQLTGIPIRLVVLKSGYRFEAINDEDEWMSLAEEPFAPYTFESGIETGDVHFSGGVAPEQPGKPEEEQDAGLLAYIILWPDGMLDAADLTLSATAANSERTIQLRSGPGGIRLLDEEKTT